MNLGLLAMSGTINTTSHDSVYENINHPAFGFDFKLVWMVAGCTVWNDGRLSDKFCGELGGCLCRGLHQPGIYALTAGIGFIFWGRIKDAPSAAVSRSRTIFITGPPGKSLGTLFCHRALQAKKITRELCHFLFVRVILTHQRNKLISFHHNFLSHFFGFGKKSRSLFVFLTGSGTEVTIPAPQQLL